MDRLMNARRNPIWTRDELILALDLYFRLRPGGCGPTLPEVEELSVVLRRLDIHPVASRTVTFRNSVSVSMKLINFRRFDPDYPGAGLSRGSKGDEQVWGEFHEDRAHLESVALALRSFAGHKTTGSVHTQWAVEGQVLTREHRIRERSSSLRNRKITRAFEQTDGLRCEACGFDFSQMYGDIGSRYIECHHIKPLAELRPGTKTRLADLAVVCANCHAMLHRGTGTRTVEQLRAVVEKRSPLAD
jgi:5-methylcytosine-specific restriction protein A